ncbi:unnamed protein product [Agarophyton chilense]
MIPRTHHLQGQRSVSDTSKVSPSATIRQTPFLPKKHAPCLPSSHHRVVASDSGAGIGVLSGRSAGSIEVQNSAPVSVGGGRATTSAHELSDNHSAQRSRPARDRTPVTIVPERSVSVLPERLDTLAVSSERTEEASLQEDEYPLVFTAAVEIESSPRSLGRATSFPIMLGSGPARGRGRCGTTKRVTRSTSRTPTNIGFCSMPVPATQFSPGTPSDPYQRSGGLPSTTQTNWAHTLAFGAANRTTSQYGPFGNTFDHDCKRLRSVPLLLKKRDQESQPRQGRLECYQSRQRHTPLTYFIPSIYPSDLQYVRIEPELDYYRRLVVQVCQYPSIPETYLPVSPDLVSLNRPFTTINWADRILLTTYKGQTRLWTVLVAILAPEAARNGIDWDCLNLDSDIYGDGVQPVGRNFFIPPRVAQNIFRFGYENIVEGTDYTVKYLDSYLDQSKNYHWDSHQGWEAFHSAPWEIVPRHAQYYPGAHPVYGAFASPEPYHGTVKTPVGRYAGPFSSEPLPQGRKSPILTGVTPTQPSSSRVAGLVRPLLAGIARRPPQPMMDSPAVVGLLARIRHSCVTNFRRAGPTSVVAALTLLEGLLPRHAQYLKALNQLGKFQSLF